MTEPTRYTFHSKSELVDYVSKGLLPPMKQDFNRVMRKVREPDVENYVDIVEGVITNEDREIMDTVLMDVYRNRIRNKNTVLTILGAASVGAFINSRFKKKRKKKLEEAYEEIHTQELISVIDQIFGIKRDKD